MDNYVLFLDEIYPGGHFDHFILAGFAIKKQSYEQIVIPQINDLKKAFFQDSSVILHEMHIHRSKSDSPYAVLQEEEKMKAFWQAINRVFIENKFIVFATCINEQIFKQTYTTNKTVYSIALEILIENFVHFLSSCCSTGDIYVESSNATPDQHDNQLQYHFHDLKSRGTRYLDRRTLQHHLGTINFPLKADNIVGLQLADLIPNSLNRYLCKKQQRTYGLINTILKLAYNGNSNTSGQFGIKIIP